MLKERGGKGRVVITGVRWEESSKRKESSDVVRIIGKKSIKKADELGADYKITKQGGIILNNDNDETRQLVEHCHIQSKVMVNPIIDWTEQDVWDFLNHYGCKSNPLYECGFKRIGCIGCPMASKTRRYKEFQRYPKYEANYKRAFAKMLEERRKRNLPTSWETAEDVFRWWMKEDPMQMRFSDLEV